MGTLLLVTLTLLGPAQDTTLAMQRGDRVVVDGISGEVRVRGWGRDELSVRGEDDDALDVGVRRSGSRLMIVTEDRMGRRRRHDVTLFVPRWADVEIRGRSLDVEVSEIGGSLDVTTLDGEVEASGVSGSVAVRTVEGEILVRRASGRVVASSEGDDVRVEDSSGASLEVESGSGDVVLASVDFGSVRAGTLDGDLSFSGEVRGGGSYLFTLHDGDLVLALPSDVGARVSVATYDADFTSEFPVTINRFSGGRAFDFVLGDGGATMELEVFDGEIRLQVR